MQTNIVLKDLTEEQNYSRRDMRGMAVKKTQELAWTQIECAYFSDLLKQL